MTSYKLGDIVLIDFPQSGSIKKKKRPALVILDIGDKDVALAPITTKKRSVKGDCQLGDWQISGLLRESWVRLAKVACLSKKEIARRLGKLTSDDLKMVSSIWRTLYVDLLCN